MEKNPKIVLIIRNQNVNPADTTSALKRGDDNSILYRINERYQATLGKYC